MGNPAVSIIIPSLNRKQYIENCLRSIKADKTYTDLEVIVIDENSVDGSARAIEKKFPWARLVKLKRVVGTANSKNIGFSLSKGKHIMLLNNDTIVLPGWLQEAVRVLESDSEIAAVGCKLISEMAVAKRTPDKSKKSLCSAALLLRKSVLRRIGNWDSINFHPIYGGETDWCYRVFKKGYKLIQLGNSFVIHLEVPKKEANAKDRFELMHTHTLRAMLFNLGLGEILGYAPGYCLIFINSIGKGMLFRFLKSIWNNVVDWERILRERKRRKRGEKIRGMDLDNLDFELDNYRDIKAIRIRDGSEPEKIV